ncbi:hypothetical protein D3C73_1295120 [compost metagenome]
MQRIDEALDISVVRLVQLKGQQAVTALEIPLPQGMAGVSGQGRMEHPLHLRLRLQPMGDFQRLTLVHLQSRRQCPGAAQHQVSVVRADGGAKGVAHGRQWLPDFLASADAAHDHIAVAAQVLGQRHDRDVRAEGQRSVQVTRAPGVVDGQ